MHSTHQILLTAAALIVSPSLAQRFNASVCASSQAALLADAPVLPTALQPYLSALTASQTAGAGTTTPPPTTLEDPEGYVALICGIAAAIPADAQPDFASYGAALLSHANFHLSAFDDFVTDCVTEGPAATSITNYLNHLVTATENLCQATPTPTPSSSSSVPVVGAGEGACPAPTLSSSSSSSLPSSLSGSPSSTLPVTAGASRPTGGVFAGAAALGGLLGAVALL